MIKTKFLGVLMVLLATLPLSAYASHFVNLEGNPGLRSASAFVTISPRPIVTCYNSQDPAWNMAHPCPGVK
jgi:hypothetical protein